MNPEEIKEGFLEHYHREISDEDVAALFENIDIDSNGLIDYSEFVVAAMSQSQLTTSDKLQAAFRRFDKDGSGIITSEEIREAFQ